MTDTIHYQGLRFRPVQSTRQTTQISPSLQPPPSPIKDKELEHSSPPLPAETNAVHFTPTPSKDYYAPDKPSTMSSYTRDPKKLTGYLIPFPKPIIQGELDVPSRFMMYTPPAPPLEAPKEGDAESKMHKIQRKWQSEVREARTTESKVTTWKGIKGRATKGIDVAMGWTTTSNLDFLNRVPDGKPTKEKKTKTSKDSVDTLITQAEKDALKNEQVLEDMEKARQPEKLEEIVIFYPASMPGTEDEIRAEFVNSMLRSKTKAQRDSIIATGLLPVTFAIDVLIMFIWPFGGLLEIDAVWLYSSLRGVKIAQSVTKRLSSEGDKMLKLTFKPSSDLEVLRRYLGEQCHKRDPERFVSEGEMPSEAEVLEALAWSPKAWEQEKETKAEDEQWEIQAAKEDVRRTMRKGAREWDRWCKAYVKEPEKAIKK